jgi:8-oxo-dGTP pyrophosphatase MutT (NUDIX family)
VHPASAQLLTDGWITETVARMIDPGETAEEGIIRETLEETGYRISRPELIWVFDGAVAFRFGDKRTSRHRLTREHVLPQRLGLAN